MTDRPRKTLAQMAANAAAKADGIACPRCGCRHLLADKTIQQMSRVVRYRRCRNCGHKVLTKQDHSPPEQIIRDVDQHAEDSSPGKPALTILRESA